MHEGASFILITVKPLYKGLVGTSEVVPNTEVFLL